MKKCPDRSRWEAFLLHDETSAPELEEHLSECGECREFVDRIWQDPEEASTLPSLAVWEKEQEEFLPSLRTMLASSFRARGPIVLEDFPFIESVECERVSGKIGDLELRELIDCGGMGAIFRAYDPPLEREVAVKVLRPEYAGSREVAALFLDEARSIASVQHENILPIFDVARSEGDIPFFVMPLVEGGRLDDRLRENGTLPLTEAVGIAGRVARGLAVAHEAGILHRDIKPSNILLEGALPGGIRIADFGLARAAHHGFGEGAVVGTPGYIAPEVAKGGEGTIQADLYSLGILLLELLTGTPPDRDGDPPSVEVDRVPERLRPLLRSLLSQEPEQRPANAKAVANVLDSFLEKNRELGRSKERRMEHRRKLARVFSLAAVVGVSAFLVDAATGWRSVNATLRKITGRPVSVTGSPGTFAGLESALAAGPVDAELIITGGASLEVADPILLVNRSVTIRSSSAEQVDLFFRNGGNGIFEVRDGDLSLSGLRIRFRGVTHATAEGLITLIESSCRIDQCSLRQTGAVTRSRSGIPMVCLRYGGTLEIDDSVFLQDRSGVGFLAVGVAGKRQRISLNQFRFFGQTLIQSVSSLPVQNDSRAALDLVVTHSSILSETPLLAGRGGDRVETSFTSRNSLWQCLGPFLSVRNPPLTEFQEHFRFTSRNSLFATDGDGAVSVGERETISDKSPEQDWNRFLSGLEHSTMEDSRWVDWLFHYRRGQQIRFNPDLDLSAVGATLKAEEFEDFP